MAGATLICNLSASDEITGKSAYRRNLVAMQSARLVCAYAYADAGNGESTTDIVFAGHNIIAENGNVLAESRRFANTLLISQVDINRLNNDRRRMTTYKSDAWKASEKNCFVRVPFSFTDVEETALTRYVDPHPFVPSDIRKREERCEEIINIQAYGLKKRLEHTNTKTVTVGISGGLDSTLALLVTRKAFELAGLPLNGIIAVTMPCFGTTDRTYNNAVKLVNTIGATLKEIRINEAVTIHLRDIGHPFEVHDVTYENAQARERTQILMDVANETGGFVIGTGDLSELALGWATYNGDHMSMYGVNASVPKTLVRYLVAYFANEEKNLSEVLNDVLDTPVSPELLPPLDGMISQKTEDIVGPYELHDFFLYYVLRYGFTPSKIYRLAKQAFSYDTQTILKWLKDFYKRFFAQQFKRSCLPDGPKVGTVAVSPRGDLRMPSDASVNMWIKEIDNLK
jgi:NAD+ synthase (glutamine-hydrolysing)